LFVTWNFPRKKLFLKKIVFNKEFKIVFCERNELKLKRKNRKRKIWVNIFFFNSFSFEISEITSNLEDNFLSEKILILFFPILAEHRR